MITIQPASVHAPGIADSAAPSSTPDVAGCVLPHPNAPERDGIADLVEIAQEATTSMRLEEAIRNTFSNDVTRLQATLARDASRMAPESQLSLLRELDGSLGTEQQVLAVFGAALGSGMSGDGAIKVVRTIEQGHGNDAHEAVAMMRRFEDWRLVGSAMPVTSRTE